jgi:hypothetical protein
VRRSVAAIVAALIATVAAPALAQNDSPRHTRGQQREEAYRMVDAYIVSQLQESLGLTDQQFVEALPLVKKLQTERRDYFLARARLLHQMRRLLRSGSATEADVVARLKELKALEAEGPEKTRATLASLDAVLTPIQQAKYRVLELEVEQRMRELMSRARQPHPDAQKPRD